jgi:hypothetical protein
MLFKSGYNLNNSVSRFINENSQVTVFSAYITLDQLRYYNINGHIKRIVIRWEIEDLIKGVSDFEILYEYCKQNNIVLYRNTRIHLKALWNNEKTLLFGSANLTGKGMGERGTDFNLELSGITDSISFEDITYLNNIIQDSQLVNERVYLELKALIEKINVQTFQIPEYPSKRNIEDDFLLSQLPMTSSPRLLMEVLKNPDDYSLDIQLQAAHDSSLYQLNIDTYLDVALSKVKDVFNNKAIIMSLKQAIKEHPRRSMGYGLVVRWIQENTTSVPTPMSWEIKQEQIVNNLYEWICFFDDRFEWDKPHYSQIIYYKEYF